VRSRQSGFSLIEMIVVVAIALVAMAFAVTQIPPAVRNAHANTAAQMVQNALRNGHDLAVADRASYEITFTAPGTILTQRIAGGVTTTVSTVQIPSDMQFTTLAAFPKTANKLPDGFGDGVVAIDFDLGVTGGTANIVYFQPDGTAVDVNGNMNNGIIYIANPSYLNTSRAVTLYGSTGRVKTFRISGVGAGISWQ